MEQLLTLDGAVRDEKNVGVLSGVALKLDLVDNVLNMVQLRADDIDLGVLPFGGWVREFLKRGVSRWRAYLSAIKDRVSYDLKLLRQWQELELDDLIEGRLND